MKLFVAAAILAGLSYLGAPYASGSLGFIDDSPCYKDKLPVVLSFNATKAGDDSATMRFGLYDNKTRQPTPAVSYWINITDAENNKTLLKETFHAENGTLTLNLAHTNQSNETAITNAHQEQILSAWVAYDTAQPIGIQSSDIGLDKAYHIQVQILGIDNIRCLFPPDQLPSADFDWSPRDGNTEKTVVVPEFTLVLLPILAAAAVGAGVIYNRVRR